MRPIVRHALVLAVLSAAGTGAFAEAVQLPFEAAVDAGRVTVDVRGGQVEVLFDAEAAPSIAVTDLLRPGNDQGFLMVERDGAALQVAQPHGDDDEAAPRLLIKLVLRPGTELAIDGEHVNVALELFGAERPADAVAPDGDTVARATGLRPSIVLDLRESVARLVGLGAALHGAGSEFTVERGSGALAIDVTGGRVAVDGFAGVVNVRAKDAEIALARAGANVGYTLQGGTLDATDGAGACTGTAGASHLRWTRWAGNLDVRGDDNHVEMTELGAADASIRIEGAGNDVRLAGISGPVTARLSGGSLDASRLAGAATLEGRDRATLRVDGTTGDLGVLLAGGATAVVHGAGQGLRVDAESARVELSAIHGLVVTARAATVIATAITGSAELHATDSELDLDLAGVTGAIALDLAGTSRARATVGAPCVVTPGSTDGLTITGCDLPAIARPSVVAGGRVPVLVRTRLSGAATLAVTAGP